MAERLTTVITSLVTTAAILVFTFIWARGNLINDKADIDYVDKEDQKMQNQFDSFKEENQNAHGVLREYTDQKTESVEKQLELLLEITRNNNEMIRDISKK